MRFVFFTNTPAHVHLYRRAVERLSDAGHEVLVLARDYGCTLALLEGYDVPHRVYGACGTTKGSVFRNLPRHYANIVPAVRSFGPDVIFGVGAYAAHAGLASGAPSVLVLDSEPTSIDHAISRPFAAAFLTPHAFRKDLGEKHYQFRGFCETAYLHPDEYTPDPGIRDALGLGADEDFVLLRFNAFGSHHDVGQSGFTPDQRRRLVETFAEHATVFVSDEGGTLDLDALPYIRVGNEHHEVLDPRDAITLGTEVLDIHFIRFSFFDRLSTVIFVFTKCHLETPFCRGTASESKL
jgi:predicted glycosyltransferase